MNCKSALLAFSFLVATGMIGIEPAQADKMVMPQWYHLRQEAYGLKAQDKQRKLEEALAAAQQYAQPDRYPESEVLFALGHWRQEEGDMAGAEKYLREAIALKEEGRKIIMTGKYTPAAGAGMFLPAYSTVERENAGKLHALANAQSWLGRTLLAERKYAEAAQVLNQSIALCDQNSKSDGEVILLPDTLLPYAQALRALHRTAEADQAEKRAKEILAKRRLVLD